MSEKNYTSIFLYESEEALKAAKARFETLQDQPEAVAYDTDFDAPDEFEHLWAGVVDGVDFYPLHLRNVKGETTNHELIWVLEIGYRG